MDVSEIRSGNQPIDGGAYLFELDEKLEFLNRCPAADPYFKRWIDGRDLINGTNRWLLWLGDAEPNFLRAHSPIKDIVERVKAFRLVSKRTATQKLAATPTRFQVETFPTSNYLAIPEVSSERRDYIPILFLSPQTICSNKIRHLVDATLYDFGILTSAMHMAWVNEISGRLKSDYQWSIKLVYNNFPWPEATEAQRGQVEAAARGVLDARENHPDATLADLYDPLTMPADLAKAHAALDRAVDRCYRPQPFPDERRRFEHLFELYEKLVAPLTGGGKKRKRRG
jgi:hypothetical protein